MSAQKIAFCFPGQGSLEAGMGREIAHGGARGDGRLPAGERGFGPRSRPALLRGPRGRARPDRGAATGARGDEPGHSGGAARGRLRARCRRRALGRRVRGACRRAGPLDRGRAHARSGAGPGDGRGGARESRLDGGDPRSRGRGRRSALQADLGCLAGELQLPGPDRHLRPGPGRGRVLQRGRGPGRAPDGEASRVRRLPQPARRARRRAPSPGDRPRADQRPDRAVHVHGDGEDRAGSADGRAPGRAADRAGALHPGAHAS